MDADTRQTLAEMNAAIDALSQAIDRLNAIIAELRLETGQLRLELQPDIGALWLPVALA